MRYAWQAKDIVAGTKVLRLRDCHHFVLVEVGMDRKPTHYVVLNTNTCVTHSSQFREAEEMAKMLTEEEFLPLYIVQEHPNDAKSISHTSFQQNR